MFLEKPDALMNDEKSVDLIMRDELHNECLIERCFDDPQTVKNSVTGVNRKYQPKKSKKTKNPMFWKPEPIRFSKHLQEILDTGLYA